MSIKTFRRYEKKYFITKTQRQIIEEAIKDYMLPDSHCTNGPYLVRTLYYDTIDNDLIRISVEGPNYKEKIRVRKYGTYNDGSDFYFLELKRKFNKLVYKRRIVLNYIELTNFIDKGIKPIRENSVDIQIINELEYFLKINKVYPTALITYSRNAYFGKDDSNFRISFDNQIKSRRKDFNFDIDEFENSIIDNDSVIMELKIIGAIPMWLTKLFSKLEIYPTGISKYGIEYKQKIDKGELAYV